MRRFQAKKSEEIVKRSGLQNTVPTALFLKVRNDTGYSTNISPLSFLDTTKTSFLIMC